MCTGEMSGGSSHASSGSESEHDDTCRAEAKCKRILAAGFNKAGPVTLAVLVGLFRTGG